MAFLHRNAPTAELSKFFYRIDLFFVAMGCAFLPIAILCIWKERKVYLWLALPSFVIGLYALCKAPFRIIQSNFGWSYKFVSTFGTLFTTMHISYMVLFVGALIYLIQKSSSKLLVKKYILILIGYPLITVTGMTITNLLVQSKPNFPPFGGILAFIQFLFLAYAVSLKPERIVPRSELKKPISELSKFYLRFLNKFQAKTPGKELGESTFRFRDCLEAIGLKGIVTVESRKLVFDLDKFANEDINEVPDNILKIMKEHRWVMEIINDFTPVLVRTYEILRLKSKDVANEWFEQILQRHGGFLAKQGVLAAMPKEVKIPDIFKELQLGRAYLFKEEKPTKAYKKLKETLNYGFASLCISKLHPQKVRERYDVGKASIFWLTFKKAEGTINPKDFVKLKRTISEFVKRPSASIVLIDCLDQIKFANGFEKPLTVLKDFRNLCNETSSIILISINPELFEKQQLAAIEKELEEVKIE